ncbi:MAG: 50S ribosomal protein L35 [Clostridia bacterium]
MPKVKSHSGASKRFRFTASGKIKRSKNNCRHILTKKSSKRKRGLRKAGYVSETQSNMVHKLLPYS